MLILRPGLVCKTFIRTVFEAGLWRAKSLIIGQVWAGISFFSLLKGDFPYEYRCSFNEQTTGVGTEMESADLRHVRYLHDHPGFDGGQHCLPHAAPAVWRQPGRRA